MGRYLLLGWQLAVAFTFYAALGYVLDRWLETEPWLLLAGLLAGLVAMFARLYQLVLELDRKQPPRSSGNGDPADDAPELD